MEFLIGVAVGYAAGWIVMKRPQWVETAIDRARDALNRG